MMPIACKIIAGVAGLLLAGSSLSGCATPADQQEPIPLKPGMYAITMNGSMFGMAAKESSSMGAPKAVCIDGTEAEMMHKLSSLVTKLMPSNADCSVRDAERHGNAISAGSSCPLDGKAGTGTMTIAFDAVVADQTIEGAYSFKVDGQQLAGDTQDQAKTRLAMASLAAMKLNVHFKRSGDCTAETRSNPWGQ